VKSPEREAGTALGPANNLEQTGQHAFQIDTKPPVVTITQPAATQYTHSSTLTLDYAATDGPAAGLNAGAGVASVTATMDGATTLAGHGLASGQAINLLTELPLGHHTFTVRAVDNVGHTGVATTAFDIVVTPDSIEEDVRQFHRSGAIRSQIVELQLLTTLDAAELAWNAGLCLAANVSYGAFATEVQTLSGIVVNPTAARILADDARYLIAHCTTARSSISRPR
jgi:hypothetical protein